MPRYEFDIVPMGKPRMTQRDRWKKRDVVLRYHAFKDLCRLLKLSVPQEKAHLTFILPMPQSWSKKKKAEMDGAPHCQKPDIDNLCKAVLDAVYEDDSGVWNISLEKRWGPEGRIIVEW